MGLYENDLVAAFDLFIPYPDQCCFSFLPICKVFTQQPATGTLEAPFPNQGPAFQQILLQMQVIKAGCVVTLRRDLHVDTHLK